MPRLLTDLALALGTLVAPPAEPSPPPVPPPVVAPACRCAEGQACTCAAADCRCPVCPTHRKPVAPPAPVAPQPPTVHRLADASGVVWSHADAAWLRQFVARRNAQLLAPPPAFRPAYRFSGGGCASGRCGR